MAFQEKQLGQSCPTDSTAVSIYSPGASTTAIISTIHICNTSNENKKYSIFLDDDGTTYDETTALYYEVDIEKKSTHQIQTHLGMNNSSGNLTVQANSGNSLTFTVHGVEVT